MSIRWSVLRSWLLLHWPRRSSAGLGRLDPMGVLHRSVNTFCNAILPSFALVRHYEGKFREKCHWQAGSLGFYSRKNGTCFLPHGTLWLIISYDACGSFEGYAHMAAADVIVNLPSSQNIVVHASPSCSAVPAWCVWNSCKYLSCRTIRMNNLSPFRRRPSSVVSWSYKSQ